jgi:hypothetical protein
VDEQRRREEVATGRPARAPAGAGAAQHGRGGEAGGCETARGDRGRRGGGSPDGRGKLPPETYRALFALSPAAYEATGHWARRAKAQLAFAPACEVERCRSGTGTGVRHLTHATIGEEEPGRDLITLCDGCHRRAEKLGRELGRVPRREEIVRLDPRRPLYEPADIAALKAKYAREA